MPQPKDETPSVATYADHEVITPANKLRKAVVAALPSDEDPVARAEAALAELAGEFAEWMQSECTRLDRARADVRRSGFTKATHEALFHAAHDIKGQAATFGFADAAGAADSLCRLVEHMPDMDRIPLGLVDQHVDAVRAIVREHGQPHAAAMAQALTKGLREITDELLERENSHRPDYLDGILAPTLAPGAA